jgi:hypothetical protein
MSLQQPTLRAPARQFKRRRADWLIGLVNAASALSWGLLIGALLMIDRAGPNYFNLGRRLLDPITGAGWHLGRLRLAGGLLLAGLAIAGFGLYLHSKRQRRKGDQYSRSLLVIVGLTFATLCLLLALFA